MSKLKIKTKERRFETARDLYGIFFEDINPDGWMSFATEKAYAAG